MRKIRKGKDFTIIWSIFQQTENGREPYELQSGGVQLILITPYRRENVSGFSISGNSVRWVFKGADQTSTGVYSLELVENYNAAGMVTVDTCKAFELVSHSCQETGSDGDDIVIEDVSLESDVAFARVGTIPSGDPMHYTYEACGAVWNATTGYWELNGLTDITNEQMRIIWRCSFDYSPTGHLPFRFAYSYCRTNFMVGQQYECFENRFLPRWLPTPAPDMLLFADEFEVLRISSDYEDGTYGLPVDDARSMFAYARKLHTVLGTVILANATLTTDIFRECNALTNIKVYGLKDSISFAESPNLSNESILYMLEKCNPPTSITITLHPDAFERAMADSDIMDWLDRLDNVTLVSA